MSALSNFFPGILQPTTQPIQYRLKEPLHRYTYELLTGGFAQKAQEGMPFIARTVTNVAQTVFYAAAAIVSIVPWMIGDCIEWLQEGNAQFDDTVEISSPPPKLDPKRTTILCNPISTHQGSFNYGFPKGSDFSQLCKEKFRGRNIHLAPGKGVDILTTDNVDGLIETTKSGYKQTIRCYVDHKLSKDMDALIESRSKIINASLTPIFVFSHLDEEGRSLFALQEGINQFEAFYKKYCQKIGEEPPLVVFQEPLDFIGDQPLLTSFSRGEVEQAIKEAPTSIVRLALRLDQYSLHMLDIQTAIQLIQRKGKTPHIVLQGEPGDFEDLNKADRYVEFANDVNVDLKRAGIASVRFEMFAEPIDLMPIGYGGLETLIAKTKKIGANTLRFNLEWADIERNQERYDIRAMSKYVFAAQEIKRNELEPMVVLHHFVTPLDEEGHNLFETAEGVNRFVNFADYAGDQLAPHVKTVLVFNELKVNACLNYILGMFPAHQIMRFWKAEQVFRNQCVAYERIHAIFKDKFPGITVGLTHQAVTFFSDRWNLIGRMIAFVMETLFHTSFMLWAVKNRDKIGLLGVQYYARNYVGSRMMPTSKRDEPYFKAMQYRFDPRGIYAVLKKIGAFLGRDVPLFVSETGMPGLGDNLRTKYYQESIAATAKAQGEGENVIGYSHWVILPNSELEKGYNPDVSFGVLGFNKWTRVITETQAFRAIKELYSGVVA